MRKVVFRDGTATACERTGDAPAAASICRTAGGAFTAVRADARTDSAAGRRL
ncbi:hypothetical protein [Streptomyces sp. SLBN-31]|jgi:hypothetical protein|uniref:hypothetical protein n=1 Tax=Streptomyces sp. SLBN-31 TaxID=2768444 RepID=UPI001175A6E9|nr:hypothetical protein [Streptomyces sp. SLBN-31]TQJ92910.1 hypothetical protein FBY22_3849 [Streptomyces sp. SLBN-31]